METLDLNKPDLHGPTLSIEEMETVEERMRSIENHARGLLRDIEEMRQGLRERHIVPGGTSVLENIRNFLGEDIDAIRAIDERQHEAMMDRMKVKQGDAEVDMSER